LYVEKIFYGDTLVVLM